MCSRFSLEMSKTGCFVCVSGIFRRKLTKEVYLGERRHCLTKVKCFLTRLILQWWSWWMNHSEWYRHPPAMIYKPVFFQIYSKDLNWCHLILWLLLAKRLRWTIGTLWEFIGQLWLFEDDGAKWGGDVNDKWGEIAASEGICERLDGEVWWGGVRWGGMLLSGWWSENRWTEWDENGSDGKQVKPTVVSFCNQTRIWESLPESESIWFGLRLTALDWG